MLQTHELDTSILTVLILIFGTGALTAHIFGRFNLPSLLAFILTGVLLGPGMLNMVHTEQVSLLAHIGIIFLLFIVGLELSFDEIRRMRFQAPAAGILQLGLTTLFLTLVFALVLGLPLQLAFLLGSILSLSSTAIVLKSLEDNRENDTHYGRLILAILIIQDLSIIPLMTLVPALMQPLDENLVFDLGWVLLKALAFSALAVLFAIRFLPYFLDRLAGTNRKEIFILALICVGVGMALFTNQLGLSYEAGAFVAGIALSESVFSRQILSDSRGFRDVFVTLFFVSMGLMFDLNYLVDNWLLVLITTVSLMVIKAIAAFLAVFILRFSVKSSLWVALSLLQVGEFSFVLLGRTLQEARQVPEWQDVLMLWSPVLVDAIIISMFLTPLIIWAFPMALQRLGKEALQRVGLEEPEPDTGAGPKRVIVGGYGPTAQNLITSLQKRDIPYIVIEMNLNTIKHLRKKKTPCVYGDISRADILNEAGIAQTSVLAITFPDIRTSEVAVACAKRLHPSITCIARSRYRPDTERLYAAGADLVIYEEFETSVSFIFNIMKSMNYPIAEIDPLINMIRQDSANKHGLTLEQQPVFGRFSILEGTQIEWLEIPANSPMVGRSLADCGIRQATGVNVLAIIDSQNKEQVAPAPSHQLNAHDVLVAVGTVEQLHALEKLTCHGRD